MTSLPSAAARLLRGFRVFDFSSAELPGEARRRRVFEALVLIECAWANLVWAEYIAHVESIAHPLGIAHHVPLDWMLDGRVPWLNAALITACLALGFARRVPWAYAAALVLMLFQYAARYSIGEIPHGANLIGMCLLAFATAPLLFRDRFQAERCVMGLVWLSISIGYVSAACCKMIATGPTWIRGEYMALSIHNKLVDAFAKSGVYAPSALQDLLVEQRWAGTLFSAAGLCFELGSVFVLHARWRPLALGALVILHLGIGFILEIWFRSATLVLVLLALPASWFAWPARERLASGASRAARSADLS